MAVNAEWDSFARDNDGENAGFKHISYRSLWEFVSCEETKDFLKLLMEHARQGGAAVEYVYRCDSPQEERLFGLEIMPLKNGALKLIHVPLDARAAHEVPEALSQNTLSCTQCLTRYDLEKLIAQMAWTGFKGNQRGTFVCERCRITAEKTLARQHEGY